ncbi:glycosyl hydrolase family 16, partial [Brachionus plicatilis]
MLLFSIPILLFGLVVAQNGIHWQGDWAFNCDFNKNDLTNARVPGSQCSNKCSQTPGCTHFVWTTYNGGTCWMKKGSVSKSNAYFVSDKSQVCGVLANSNNQPPVSSSGSIESLKGQLLWSDEFDSISNFMNNWNQETGGHGWGNNELQYYTNNNHNTEINSG